MQRKSPVGASLLAKNPKAPLGIRPSALSFTPIASKLAPTEGHRFTSLCPAHCEPNRYADPTRPNPASATVRGCRPLGASALPAGR